MYMYNDEYKLFTANAIAKYGIAPITGSLTPIETKALLYIIWRCSVTTPDIFDLVEMPISELCRALGYHNDKNRNFSRNMKLVSDAITGLTIPFRVCSESGKKFISMSWFQTVSADYDADILSVRFNTDLAKYFGPELKQAFIVIKLKYLNRLRTSAAITLYPFFCRYKNLNSFNYSVDDLKELLSSSQDCDYKHLKKNYIIPAIDAINSQTDITVSFSENKKGRKVTSLAFTVKNEPANLELEEFCAWYGTDDKERAKLDYDETWMDLREYDMAWQCYQNAHFD